MNKKIKIIELLNKIANGELKERTKIIYKHMTFIYDYPNVEGVYLAGCKKSRDNNIYSFINTQDIKFSSVEIIEEQEEIEELEELDNWFVDERKECREFDIQAINLCFSKHRDKINELVQAVKQLDKKINDK